MKTNHLFACSAIAAVFVAMAPAHAQLLGGGLRGGVSGMQSATLGGGFAPARGSFNDQTAASVSGHASAPTHAIDRASKAAKSGANEGRQPGERLKMDAVTTGRRVEDISASEAATADGVANAAVNRTAASAATGVTTATQSETSAGKVSTKPSSTPRTAPPASQAAPARPSDSPGSRRTETSARDGSETTGTTTDASASASMNASATS